MPDFNTDITEEIDFARSHFNFVEITLKDNDLTKQRIKFLKGKTKDLKVFGHLHWEINLNNQLNVLKHLKAYKEIGVKQITIHPSPGVDLEVYLDFCKNNHIQLLVENNIHEPFNTIQAFKMLFKQYPSLGMTFDWGHSQFKPHSTRCFLNLFAKKIKHIHLHYAYKQNFDHLPFSNKQSSKKCFQFLRYYKIKPTITLEIFYNLVNNKRVPLTKELRKGVILKQLNNLK